MAVTPSRVEADTLGMTLAIGSATMANALWVLTADDRCGQLLRVVDDPAGELDVVVVDEIHDTSADRGIEAEQARFAKEIAVWVEQQAAGLLIDRIAVFAPPRFLAALRVAWSSRFAIRVDEHHDDLTDLTPSDLARHDAIVRLVSGRLSAVPTRAPREARRSAPPRRQR